ncbi:MAG: methylenetetrahydrofolate reductase [NAD(P)H] [Deltaproteobacteria bacterium]|nr:MAG: methylenetetrahydrofolate reductase [NAD(P)H] [Deltaproteobacteria bacterium]
MTIKELFTHKKVFSFEVFPPKKNSSITTIYDTLAELSDLQPDFISVTYGAGGNAADNTTCEIASFIKKRYNINSLAHLTCINSSKKDVDTVLESLKKEKITNILALRGDINPDIQRQGDFHYASELVEYIKEKGDFSISGACYPEGHLESENAINDIHFLKQKVDAGVDHLISQLFFDNNLFYSFIEKTRIAGITVPIQAGIMPVVNKKQIERMVSLCGVSLPAKFSKTMKRFEYNNEALRDAGIAYAVNQIIDLVANGVDGIHLYTMNNPYIARKIAGSIKNIIA